MRLTGLLVAAASGALLAGCGIGAPSYPSFEEASYRIEGNTASPDGQAATHTVIYRDGPKMRVEAVLPQHGQATIVFDQATNAAYVLSPTAATPAAAPVPTAAPATTTAPAAGTTTAPAAAPATTTAPAVNTPVTGAVPNVAAAPASVIGVAVRVDDADAPQPLETAWAALGGDNARSTGECEVAGEDGHEWQPKEAQGGVQRTACITDDGIVLRVREDDRVIWEATSLQRGQQDAALFGIPAGYQVINPDAVAQQVGETMEQLDSVTGAGQQAPAATPAPRAPNG